MPGQARVGGEFRRVQAMTDDAGIADLIRQVAHPTRHQVEHHAARRDNLPIQVGHGRDRCGIDMGHEARPGVEDRIGIAIVLGERVRREILGHRGAAPEPTAWPTSIADGRPVGPRPARRGRRGVSQSLTPSR